MAIPRSVSPYTATATASRSSKAVSISVGGLTLRRTRRKALTPDAIRQLEADVDGEGPERRLEELARDEPHPAIYLTEQVKSLSASLSRKRRSCAADPGVRGGCCSCYSRLWRSHNDPPDTPRTRQSHLYKEITHLRRRAGIRCRELLEVSPERHGEPGTPAYAERSVQALRASGSSDDPTARTTSR